jgi:DNA-directed RNA polymerase specialized sigma24 family protein
LTNGEAATVLGIEERAAAKRYVRALGRLKKILSDLPGGLTEVRL